MLDFNDNLTAFQSQVNSDVGCCQHILNRVCHYEIIISVPRL